MRKEGSRCSSKIEELKNQHVVEYDATMKVNSFIVARRIRIILHRSVAFLRHKRQIASCKPLSFSWEERESHATDRQIFRDRSLTRSTLVRQLGNIGIAYVYCHNFIPKLWPLSLPCLRNFCDITVFYNYLRAWKEREKMLTESGPHAARRGV